MKPNVAIHQGARCLPYTHVASGLAVAACRQGRKVRFYNAAGLVNELVQAQQEYRLSRVMTQITKHDLVVLDELGFIPFTTTVLNYCFNCVQPSMNGLR